MANKRTANGRNLTIRPAVAGFVLRLKTGPEGLRTILRIFDSGLQSRLKLNF